MTLSQFDRFRRLLVSSASRRSTLRALVAGALANQFPAPTALEASKRGRRRRRRRKARQRERLCQQICGGSCQACRDLCAVCGDVHPCFHLTDAAQPICKFGLITNCQPCSVDSECDGGTFCVTGRTFDGATTLIAQCTYSVEVCMEELP
jgi:hypothetical protein